jgi:hypothetical protein
MKDRVSCDVAARSNSVLACLEMNVSFCANFLK